MDQFFYNIADQKTYRESHTVLSLQQERLKRKNRKLYDTVFGFLRLCLISVS